MIHTGLIIIYLTKNMDLLFLIFETFWFFDRSRKVVPDFFHWCAKLKSRQIKAQFFYAFTKISKKAEFHKTNIRSEYNFWCLKNRENPWGYNSFCQPISTLQDKKWKIQQNYYYSSLWLLPYKAGES